MKSTITLYSLSMIFMLSSCLNAQDSNAPDSRGDKDTSSNQSEMLEEALSSVVTVAVYKTAYAKQQLGMRGGENAVSEETYKAALDMAGAVGSGSGFIIERGGQKYVVTNAHVIESASDEPESVFIFTYDRTKYEVEVIGGDSFYDFAILRFKSQPGNDVVAVDYKQTTPRVGEKVFAIGNPLGEYPYTITDGIISALNRARGGITGKFGFLQTTATVIWGNSGGPLVDANGDVAGINSQIAFASAPDGSYLWQSQINFALEAEIAEKLTNDILENDGRVVRSYIGMEVGEQYGYDYGYEGTSIYKMDEYPVIKAAIPGAPSYSTINASIGAQIIEVNGMITRNIDEVLGEFEKSVPGNELTITLSKNGSQDKIQVKTGALETEQLESIGKFIIERDQNINANMNQPGVVLTPNRNNQYHKYEDQGYNQSSMGTENYFVVAGGVYDENGSDIWQIEGYNDLGAVLKLCGLYGVFDFFVIPEGGTEADLDIYRQHLSGSDEILQKTLWY